MPSQPPLPEFTERTADGNRVVQVVDEPRPSVASLTPLKLVGEPATDKGFVVDGGKRIRARLVEKENPQVEGIIDPSLPVEKNPMERTILELSLALLDDKNEVQKDAKGEFKITPKHEIYLVPGLMVEGFDLAAFIDTEIRKEAYRFQVMEDQKVEIDAVLADWGGAA